MKKIMENWKRHVEQETELKEYEEEGYPSAQFTPEQQAVMDKMDELHEALEVMGESNPEMTDYYIHLFRALKRAGVNVDTVAQMA